MLSEYLEILIAKGLAWEDGVTPCSNSDLEMYREEASDILRNIEDYM